VGHEKNLLIRSGLPISISVGFRQHFLPKADLLPDQKIEEVTCQNHSCPSKNASERIRNNKTHLIFFS